MNQSSQSRLFHKVRMRIMRNSGSQLFASSKIRFISMLLCSGLIAVALLLAAWLGFSFLAEKQIFFAGSIIGLLFDVMFFTLGGLLVFSTGLILYASLFTGSESKFLLTTPARADQIFAIKFQEAVLFSSWAFVVLGGPVLIAYGMVFHVPWTYYALLPIWLMGYVIMPGAAGAIMCLLIVNYFPRRRKQALLGLLVLLTIAAGYWIYRMVALSRWYVGNREALESVFSMFALANSPLSPSRWMSRGLLAMARDDLGAMIQPLAMLWSNALFCYLIAAYLAKKLYRRGFNRMSGEGGSRKVYGSHWLDRVMDFLVSYLDPKTRLLIVKDFRTFRREPAQVAQLGIFAGLMLLCVTNIRQFFGADLPSINQSVVSFLNLCATGLLICAYLARFVYPLISLEGRKFWILGLLPLKREQLLWGKFAFAATMTMVLGGGIVLVSDLVLDLPLDAIVLHQATIATLSFGLSGLCVGMGAWMPNFRETDPSKIVVGFGGTMFTISSLMFLALSIIMMCVPFHFVLARSAITGELPTWTFLGIPAGMVMAIVAVRFPMRLGGKTLREMEF